MIIIHTTPVPIDKTEYTVHLNTKLLKLFIDVAERITEHVKDSPATARHLIELSLIEGLIRLDSTDGELLKAGVGRDTLRSIHENRR